MSILKKLIKTKEQHKFEKEKEKMLSQISSLIKNEDYFMQVHTLNNNEMATLNIQKHNFFNLMFCVIWQNITVADRVVGYKWLVDSHKEKVGANYNIKVAFNNCTDKVDVNFTNKLVLDIDRAINSYSFAEDAVHILYSCNQLDAVNEFVRSVQTNTPLTYNEFFMLPTELIEKYFNSNLSKAEKAYLKNYQINERMQVVWEELNDIIGAYKAFNNNSKVIKRMEDNFFADLETTVVDTAVKNFIDVAGNVDMQSFLAKEVKAYNNYIEDVQLYSEKYKENEK